MMTHRIRFAALICIFALPSVAMANEEQAIQAVQQFAVPELSAVQAHINAWQAQVQAKPDAASPAPEAPKEPLPTITLGELSAQGHLAQMMSIQGLTPGEWKAKAGRGSVWIVKQLYTRNNATIAPCWHVDLTTGQVKPHNDLARLFHVDPVDPDSLTFATDLMANRVRVAASHANAYGLPLGAAALGVFAYRDNPADDDAVFGWLIDHAGGSDEYLAIFQWRSGGTRDNARWKVARGGDIGPETPAAFMRASRAIRADNHPAHRLMEDISTFGVRDEQFVIAPDGFADVPMLPRKERLSGDLKALCGKKKNRAMCNAWLRVLEDETLMLTTRALVAGQLSASYCTEDDLKRDWHCVASVGAHKRCVADGLCRWETAKEGSGYAITYLYESADAELGVTFGVDPKTGDIQPLDAPAAWILQAAGYDIAPNTSLVEPQRQVAFFNPENVAAHVKMVSARYASILADAKLESTNVDLGGGGGSGGPLTDDEIQDPVYSSPAIDDISRCLEAEYNRTGGAIAIKIDVSYNISSNGKVKRFRTTAPDISTDSCLRKVFETIQYRPVKGPARKVSFPFEFS